MWVFWYSFWACYGPIPCRYYALHVSVCLNCYHTPFPGSESSYLHTLRLAGNFDLKSKDAERLSNPSSLTNLDFNSLHDLDSSRNWLQMITKPIQNLRELRLVDCSLSDNDHQYADILNISSVVKH